MDDTKYNNCAAQLPYPNTAHVQGTLEQGRLLSAAYGGSDSELSAMSQYTYQYIILKNKYPDIAEMLLCIAHTERDHFLMLGEIMENCGVDPRLAEASSGRERYWSASNAAYIRDVQGILLEDIAGEHKAIRGYERLMERIRTPVIDAVLRRIILDEQLHIEMLSGIYAAFVEAESQRKN